jgi:hypothetical protein
MSRIHPVTRQPHLLRLVQAACDVADRYREYQTNRDDDGAALQAALMKLTDAFYALTKQAKGGKS